MEGNELRDGIKIITDAIKRLLNWEGLAKFVQAFPDPIFALIGIALIFLSVLGSLVAIMALVTGTMRARIRADRDVDLALARHGFVRPRSGSSRMLTFLLAVLLIVALCTVAVLATLIWTERVKADYERAVFFSGRFAREAEQVMMAQGSDPRAGWLILNAAARIGNSKWAREACRAIRRAMPERSPAELEPIIGSQNFLTAFRDYLFAASYFAGRQGEALRRFTNTAGNIQLGEAAYFLLAQEVYGQKVYWRRTEGEQKVALPYGQTTAAYTQQIPPWSISPRP